MCYSWFSSSKFALTFHDIPQSNMYLLFMSLFASDCDNILRSGVIQLGEH